MEGPGLGFQGAGGQPGSAPCSCVTWQTSEGNPRLRASLPPVFSFLPDPLGGVGGCFLAAVAGFMGISEGNDGGDVPRAVKPEFFRQGSYLRSVPLNVVDLPSPGWMGKGHGTRVGSGGLPWGFWFPPCVTGLVFANGGYDNAFAQVCQANVRVWGEFPPIPTPDSRSAKGGLSARRTPRRIFDIYDLAGHRNDRRVGGWG